MSIKAVSHVKMAPGIRSLVDGGALPCVFLLSLALWEAATESVARPSGFVHQGRSLTFPYGFGESYLEFTFGVGLPMNLPSPYQVSMSLEMRADYKYPVNASDFTNPTKRREDEEKEKEEMEKKKEKKTQTMNGGVSSADITQTGANGGGTKIKDNIKNTTDILNSTECPNDSGKLIGTIKSMTKEDSSNITNANVGEVTNCFGNNSKPIETGDKKNKLLAKNLEESVFSEYKGFVVNITNQPEHVSYPGEDSTNKTNKIASENMKQKDPGRRKGGARFIRKRELGGRSTRWRIYHVLEMAANTVGMDGRGCLLRSICDAAATPLHHRSNELVGELLHVLFTPSTTDDDRGRYLDNEYRAAERLGADVGNSCELLYPECDVSFLDLITTFDLF